MLENAGTISWVTLEFCADVQALGEVRVPHKATPDHGANAGLLELRRPLLKAMYDFQTVRPPLDREKLPEMANLSKVGRDEGCRRQHVLVTSIAQPLQSLVAPDALNIPVAEIIRT